MNEQPEATVLITLTGKDRPGVTSSVFETLARFGVEVLDIEQIVLRGRLILGLLVSSPRDWKALRDAVQQVWTALFDALGKEGLERIDPVSEPFDPNEHEAVMHEPGDGPAKVVDVMRAGYRWKGRVLRPAMVKVAGS